MARNNTGQANECPWSIGTRLRVIVDDPEYPDLKALPCIPADEYSAGLVEIPNTKWVTYVGPTDLGGGSILYKFQYMDTFFVFIPQGVFKFLVYIPQRQTGRNRFR